MKELSLTSVGQGAPYSLETIELKEFLCQARMTDFVRVFLCLEFFQQSESLLSSSHASIETYKGLLMSFLEFSKIIVKEHACSINKLIETEPDSTDDPELFTKSHYSSLFSAFSPDRYFEETFAILGSRLERNGLLERIRGLSSCLDLGCGGGRYTYALSRFGFEVVTGIDFSDKNISFALSQSVLANEQGLKSPSFEVGNVLNVKHTSSSFDFIFSNGVLHHTPSIRTGLGEIYRLLRDNGLCFLYLIGAPGGIKWNSVEILRHLMANVNQGFARECLRLMGVPSNRVFYILDHILVPINSLTLPSTLESIIAGSGYSSFERLFRGTDYDIAELEYRSDLSPEEKYWVFGNAELRYLLSK